MPGLATRRLNGAAGALAPADRALLDLWIHRGLDDDRLATLTGLSALAVQGRRARIVAALSHDLGLPEADVLQALRLEPDAPPPPLRLKEVAPEPSRPQRLWAMLTGGAAVIVAIVAVIVALSSRDTPRASDVGDVHPSAATSPTATRPPVLTTLVGTVRHLELRLTVRHLPRLHLTVAEERVAPRGRSSARVSARRESP